MRLGQMIVLALALAAVWPQAGLAQWREQEGKVLEDTEWRKAKGDFGAQLLLTDDHEKLFREWATETKMPTLETVARVERGAPVAAVVMFVNCEPDARGLCQSTVEYTVWKPDGSIYAEVPNAELWSDKPAPRAGTFQLGIGYVVVVIEAKDPLGEYTVKADVRDLNRSVRLRLERKFTVVEQDR